MRPPIRVHYPAEMVDLRRESPLKASCCDAFNHSINGVSSGTGKRGHVRGQVPRPRTHYGESSLPIQVLSVEQSSLIQHVFRVTKVAQSDADQSVPLLRLEIHAFLQF